MSNKKILRSTFIGFALLLISLVITGLVGISDLINSGKGELYGRTFNYGFIYSMQNYFKIWRPSQFVHETAYIAQVLMFVAIFATLVLIIMAIAKKKPACILSALFLGAGIAYIPFILILVVPMVQMGVMKAVAMALMSGVTGLTLFAIYFEVLALKELIKDSLALLNKAGGEEKQEEEQKPCPCEQKEAEPVEPGLSEEEVRAIVEKYLEEHVEEKHPDGAAVVAAAPAKEEPQPEPEPEEEEPEEEEEEEEEEEAPAEAPADDNAPAG